MSKFMILAGIGLAATLVSPGALAQTRPAGTTVTVARGVVATSGRPTLVERKPIRPRGGDDDSHLRERLRNACFNEPNPPSPLCRRVFGDQPGAGARTDG